MKQRLMWISTVLLLAPTAVAGGGQSVPAGNTIAAIVSNDPNFSTLLAAVQAAGLTQTLAQPGPYTVFAPTNAAFAKIPADQLQALLNNPAQLRAVLLYHVVPGRVTAAQVTRLSSARTVQGANVTINASGGMVMINDATVTRADVRASNGIIHVVDTVLLPPN
ncbi:fasciclin domain-containing protein [Deinococcus sp. MIMF12]|uniref:Fasciclin domain-containing protein n=1 Tax=Deinococcus rhizophilus TaxID=3049544 RepID=A0ABT7JIK3_9DEIO|nr:fasciclin domain-containing protein [Deinococcus rhizophilus]MDL2343793.1 fasciclin domain-containing protein [Deinococcus rhizophilus]